jgi:nucleoside phosphorylase
MPDAIPQPPVDVLLVTVTPIEASTVLRKFQEETNEECKSHALGAIIYYNLGIVGGASVFMIRTEMGSATPGGSLSATQAAIAHLRPRFVISVGIAFGMKKGNQNIGDILISKQMASYEPQKIKPDDTFARGDTVTVLPPILTKVRDAENYWLKTPKLHIGLIISGEKLVNSPDYLAALQGQYPEAIGGEMEGAGVYAAASASSTPWIVIKAICDWGDGDKNDDHQSRAAKNATDFVVFLLKRGFFVQPTTQAVQQVNLPDLTIDAQNFLISTFDNGGKIVREADPMGGFVSIRVGNKPFYPSVHDEQGKNSLDKLIQELIHKGLVSRIDSEGETFSITELGNTVAEKLKP